MKVTGVLQCSGIATSTRKSLAQSLSFGGQGPKFVGGQPFFFGTVNVVSNITTTSVDSKPKDEPRRTAFHYVLEGEGVWARG